MLHVDLDQFLASVEVLRRPELAGLPVVVGGRGDPTERGVVSTASYEARAFGVRSGMPLRTALKKCPEAVFLAVDLPVYEAASATVMDTLRAALWAGDPVDVEVLGWDEAFVGLRPGADPAHEHDPMAFAGQLRAEVLAATGLHCSVGVGDTTLQAKIATDFGKPRGVYRISDASWSAEMGDRPTRALWGVGAKVERRLADLGIRTVAQLAASDERVLAAEIGPTMGPYYHRLGRGVGNRVVDPTPWVPRAHGREETFQTDLDDEVEIEAAVRRITRRVVADIDAEGRPAWRVGLKVRDRAFQTVQRSRKLPAPTADPDELADAVVALLTKVERKRPVRLLGVRLEMVEPEGGYLR